MWDCIKFMYEVPNHIALNHTTQSQTKAYITKLSHEVCTLLRYYVAWHGNSLPMFRGNLSIPSSRVKKSKQENEAQLKLNDACVWGGASSII